MAPNFEKQVLPDRCWHCELKSPRQCNRNQVLKQSISMFTGFLFCASWISDPPFTASLCGIHNGPNEAEDEDHLSWKLFTAEMDTSSFEQPGFTSREADHFPQWSYQNATPIQSATPLIRAPRLPRLQCQIPARPEQPVSFFPYSTPTRSQSDKPIWSPILPSPIVLSKSVHSRHASSLSPVSSLSRNSTIRSPSSTKPKVPRIPKQYRSQSNYGSPIDGTPTRPNSRPSMPPAAFWKFAAEQQVCRVSEGGLQTWQTDNNTKIREPSVYRYPIIGRPQEKPANRNRRTRQSSTRSVRGQSCNRVETRISNISDDAGPRAEPGPGNLSELREPQPKLDRGEKEGRPQSKRLIKKRQPWDTEPQRKSWNWI